MESRVPGGKARLLESMKMWWKKEPMGRSWSLKNGQGGVSDKQDSLAEARLRRALKGSTAEFGLDTISIWEPRDNLNGTSDTIIFLFNQDGDGVENIWRGIRLQPGGPVKRSLQ